MYDDKKVLDEAAIAEVHTLFEKTEARSVLERYAARYKEKAIQALTRTKLPDATKIVLERVTHALVPDAIIESR